MIPINDNIRTEGSAIAVWTIMALCCVVFLLQLFSGDDNARLIVAFGFIPAELLSDAVLPSDLAGPSVLATMVTYMFLHGGWLHLLGNLLFLWIFADNVEDALGHPRFILFFVLCGIGAALAQAIPASDSLRPMIGASGGVSGVLGAYLLLYPRAEISVIVPVFVVVRVVRLPAWIVLLAWFLFQLLYSVIPDEATANIAFLAHMGGFAAGLLLALCFAPRLRGWPWRHCSGRQLNAEP
jgi:membrane associated rhomboid family serine protease